MAEGGGLGGLLPPVVLELMAKTDKLKEGLAEARTNVTEMAEKSGSSVQKFGQISSGILMAAAGTAIALGVAAIHMADDYERSHARLETAVKNVGQNFEEFKGKIDATNSKLEGFGFTNAETESALARLTVATHDVGKATELMGLAADIARGRNIDLQSATDLLVKVEAGRYTQLTKLGIATKEQVAGFKDSSDAVKLLSDTFGGAAQQRADTFAGKMEALHAKVTDLGAQIGMVLIPIVEDLVSRGLGMVDWLQSANEATGGLLGKITLLAGAGVGVTLAIGSIVNVVTRLATSVASTVSLVANFATTLALLAATNPEIAGLVALGAVVAYVGLTSKESGDKVSEFNNDVKKLGGVSQYSEFLRGFTDASKNAGDAAQQAAGKTANMAAIHQRFLDLLKQSPEAAMQFKKAADDAGISTQDWGGDIRAAAVDAAKGRQATEQWSGAVDDASASLDDGAVSAKEAKAALDAYTASTKDGQKAVDDMVKALNTEYDSLSKNTTSMLDAQNQQIATNASLADYGKTLKDTKLTVDQHTTALNDMEKQLIDTAVKTADAATATTNYGSAAEQASAKASVQKQYLEAVAATLAPGSDLRNGLEAYIAKLDSIKTNINTTINVDTDAANAKLAQWEANAKAAAAGVQTAIVTSRVDPAGAAHNAAGTSNWRGGPTWVNEFGGEIIDLPSGARIIPADKAKGMGGLYIENVTVGSANDFKSLADELTWLTRVGG